MDKPKAKKLKFSVDQSTRRKFLKLVDFVLQVHENDQTYQSIFRFSRDTLEVNIYKQKEIECLLTYTTVHGLSDENKEHNSFKHYELISSSGMITLEIAKEQIEKISHILTTAPQFSEIAFDAKRAVLNNQNVSYLEVLILGVPKLEFRDMVIFRMIQAPSFDFSEVYQAFNINFDDQKGKRLNFYQNFLGTINLKEFKVMKFTISKIDEHYAKIQLELKDGKRYNFNKIKHGNSESFLKDVKSLYVDPDKVNRVVKLNKSAQNHMMAFSSDGNRIFLIFNFLHDEPMNDNSGGSAFYEMMTYSPLEIICPEEEF